MLTLKEWTPSSPVRLDYEQIAFLRDVFACQVSPAPGGLFTVRPGNKVGAGACGDLQVQVRPKIRIDRVLFLLAYAAGAWPQAHDATLGADDFTAGIADLYATLCERATRRGVLAGYREVEDRLHTVRGRIDIAQQVKRGQPGLPVAVRHQEFDADIPENRLLMAGLRAFRSAPVHVPSTLTRLHRLRTLLGAVTPVVPRDIRWTPLNQHYRPAAELAWLLLDGRAADLAHGSTEVPAFVLDMGTVFERFVRVALRIALGVAEHDFPSGRNAPRVTLDDLGELVTEPDLNLLVDGERRFVGEIKYKVDTGRAKAADRYQLLAAAIATGLPDATLVYAEGPGAPTAVHTIPRAGVRLHLHRLDLAAPPEDVLAQIDRLAGHVRRC